MFEDISFPDGKGYEDAYTTYKLLYKAERIVYINEVLYYWFDNKESYSSKKDKPKKLLFREEAIKEQAMFYDDEEYHDVSNMAKAFYLNQMHLMLWQLDHDFIQNKETRNVRKYFQKQAKKYYHKYSFCLIKSDKDNVFEYLFPYKSAIINKLH